MHTVEKQRNSFTVSPIWWAVKRNSTGEACEDTGEACEEMETGVTAPSECLFSSSGVYLERVFSRKIMRFNVGLMPAAFSSLMRDIHQGYTLKTATRAPITEAMAEQTYETISKVVGADPLGTEIGTDVPAGQLCDEVQDWQVDSEVWPDQ
jgi:hypothetical protein